MSKRRESSGQVVVVVALLLLFLLPVLYVLSLGPAIMLSEHGYLNSEVWDWVYAPLVLIYESCPPTQKPLEWYASLFEQ